MQKVCLSVRNEVGEYFCFSVTQPLAMRFDKRVWFTQYLLSHSQTFCLQVKR